MNAPVLAALERLEAAIVEMELLPESPAEAAAEAKIHLRALAEQCQAQGLRDLDPPCQWMNSLLDLVIEEKAQPGQEMVDLLLGPIDFMRRLIFLAQSAPTAAEAPPAAGAPQAATPAAPAAKDEAVAPPAALRSGPSAIKVETEKLDALLDLLGELVITFALSARHPALSLEQNRVLQENMTALGGLLEGLERQVAAIRMLHLNTLFLRMQRLVRDVSGKVGKPTELISRGGEIELDKGLIEELNDPLVHLLRNAIDHGVEEPAQRQAQGKPPQARLELSAEREERFLVIAVTDDGRGLDKEKILNKARERGLAQPGAAYTDQEIFRFITEAGFSTAETVTDISGRGVGLDVVARAVTQMGADLRIASSPGKGSTFSIRLPLDRVVSDGITEAILFKVGGEIYAVPSRQVTEVLSFDRGQVFTLGERQVLEYRGQFRPLLDLARVMEIPGEVKAPPTIVVMVTVSGRDIALAAHELIGHQQVVLRSLEKRAFPGVVAISGCALMGDRMGLMLDLEGLASMVMEIEDASASEAHGGRRVKLA